MIAKALLPLHAGSKSDQPMMAPHLWKTKTVMLVDCRPETCVMTGRILRHEGYTVVTAASGQEAIAMLRPEAVPRLVLDMILEGSAEGLDCYRGVFAIFEWLSEQELMMRRAAQDRG
jgi:ActR/RegA family two-component response regulator